MPNPGSLPVPGYANAAPTGTSQYYAKGTVLWNRNPEAGEPSGWQCTEEGRPGTWKALPPIMGVSNIAAAGVLTPTFTDGIITNTSAGTYTLAAASLYAPGTELSFYNAGAAAATLVAGSGNTLLGGAVTSTTSYSRMKVKVLDGYNWVNNS